ncbi:MAG: nucleotidyltransferase family protein [Hyphomonas sp.]|uniref:nucleotidyltransferase family protein n=1 Tax=Hyphomonas sp. TaxID=87 RepID=UPI0035294AA2
MSVPVPHTAMVLAAGLGTRMRPLTDGRPKPLIQVNGKALIDRMLDPLVAAGVKRAIVNVHYLADQVEAHLASRNDIEIVISDERGEVLETGGALAKARALLGDDPILVANTDAFWAPASPQPVEALAAAFEPAQMDALLLLADTGRSLGFDGAGDFFRGDDGALTRRGEAISAPFAYCGLRIIRPQLYDNAPVERFSALRVWDALIPEKRLHGLVLDRFWLHVGDPGALKDAEMWLTCHGG